MANKKVTLKANNGVTTPTKNTDFNDLDLYPSLFRAFDNGNISVEDQHKNTSPEASNNTKHQQPHNPNIDWDLYPLVARVVENEGSVEQCKKLHSMQHT